jgi:hypothetical protein
VVQELAPEDPERGQIKVVFDALIALGEDLQGDLPGIHITGVGRIVLSGF